MLIIPAEKSVDWKHPPWVTLGLVLACVLVFVFYQGRDPSLLEQAVRQYQQDNLLALEAPVYEDYLERRIRFEQETGLAHDLKRFRELRAQEARDWMAVTLLSDRNFYHYLLASQDILWAPAERAYWREHRLPLDETYVRHLSINSLGLVPAQMTLYSLVTYAFLHGGWGHLLGNLVFLFLLGFTVERALGPGRFLLAYLLCGALSGLVFAAASIGSMTPLVGASGAISGLMGMYVAIYGLRKIRFFYFLGVYFNYFRAPALALLPVWLAKEVYDYWFAGATGIAYMAHAGGLVAGAALVWLFGHSWLQVRKTFFEPEESAETGEDARFTEAYARAMASLGQMEFDRARHQFEAMRKQYPDRPIILRHLYQLARLRPDLPAYRKLAREWMLESLKQRQPEQMLAVWQEYVASAEGMQPLTAGDHNRALVTALGLDDFRTAEKAFERLRAAGDADLSREACRLLIREYEKRHMEPKARHFRQQLQAMMEGG